MERSQWGRDALSPPVFFFFALCLFGKSTNRLPVIIWDTDVCFLITDTIHV